MHGRLERRAESDRGMVGDLYNGDLCGLAYQRCRPIIATGETLPSATPK